MNDRAARVLMIAAGALALGVVGARVLDHHSHACDRCGCRWSHLGAFNGGNVPAHSCPRCGWVQWWKEGVPPQIRELHEQMHGPVVNYAPAPQPVRWAGRC
jgi:hypothetical protein